MNILYKLKNHKLRYREKFNGAFHWQLIRLLKNMATCPRLSLRQGMLKVVVGLTYRCQCNCVYCCSGRYRQVQEDEFTTNDVMRVLDQISSIPSFFTVVTFFGGEPLLREDIYELITYAHGKGLFTEVETNGILLDSHNVKKLKRSKINHVFVRIESSKAKNHDMLSNRHGCHEMAIDGIKNCVRESVACTLSTIAMKDKIYSKELEDIIKIGKELGVASVRLLYPTPSGNWLNQKSLMLNDFERKEVGKLLERDFVYLESTYSTHSDVGRICPAAQKKFFYISPYGEIQACPFSPCIYGDIRSEKLSIILGRMWRQPSFNDKKNRVGCLVDRGSS